MRPKPTPALHAQKGLVQRCSMAVWTAPSAVAAALATAAPLPEEIVLHHQPKASASGAAGAVPGPPRIRCWGRRRRTGPRGTAPSSQFKTPSPLHSGRGRITTPAEAHGPACPSHRLPAVQSIRTDGMAVPGQQLGQPAWRRSPPITPKFCSSQHSPRFMVWPGVKWVIVFSSG